MNMASISFDCPMLCACISTLSNTSLDDHCSNRMQHEYMTKSNLPVYDLDMLKTKYFETLSCCEEACSADALFVDNAGKGIIIEFKNGHISSKEAFGVLKKAYDSTIVLADLCNFHVSSAREELDFVLVYNKNKNYDESWSGGKRASDEPKRERHFDAIQDQVSKLAKTRIDRFGLKKLEGYLFRNVYTYTESEFEQLFVNVNDVE